MKLIHFLFLAVTALILSPSVSANEDILATYKYVTPKLGNFLFNSTEKSVCWDRLGCIRHNSSFGHINLLPNWVDTIFEVHTRHAAVAEVPYDKVDTIADLVDPAKPLTVIIHGFTENRKEIWIQDLTQALLQQKERTVVVVDWGPGAVFPHYYQSAVNTELVGRQTALMINITGVPLSNVHVVGFSLGAHAAGFCGKWVKESQGSLLSKLTALDPASYLFEGYDSSVRVDRGDAKHVEVIHTNAASSYAGGLGMHTALGHMDIYPHGGAQQPGCPNTLVGGMEDMLRLGKTNIRVCNHHRSTEIFIDIVRGGSLPLILCPQAWSDPASCTISGHIVQQMTFDTEHFGVFYTLTLEATPFFGNIYQLVLYPSAESSTSGSFQLHLQDRQGNIENHDLGSVSVSHPKEAIFMIITRIKNPVKTSFTFSQSFISRLRRKILYLDKIILRDFYKTLIEHCEPKKEVTENKCHEIANKSCDSQGHNSMYSTFMTPLTHAKNILTKYIYPYNTNRQ